MLLGFLNVKTFFVRTLGSTPPKKEQLNRAVPDMRKKLNYETSYH
jgi:hypothetical protein